jgi:hypothetical protein
MKAIVKPHLKLVRQEKSFESLEGLSETPISGVIRCNYYRFIEIFTSVVERVLHGIDSASRIL